jgi:hypothetical protein
MPSRLTFSATKLKRDELLLRNLRPYNKPGVYTPVGSPGVNEYIRSDYSVIDSPDALIDSDPFADKLYTNNVFGPLGGYNKDISGLINTQQTLSNQGPYTQTPPYTEALQLYSVSFQKRQYIKNVYSPGNQYTYYDMGDVIKVQKNATYWDPPSFRPSSYSPYSVLLEKDPVGDNGPASDDSQLAQMGVKGARQAFQYRVDQNVRTQTLGRVNILNGVQDPVNLSLILAGKKPLIYRDWKITSGGGNIISQGQDIVQRIAGFTLPFSPIPGSYYEARDINSTQSAIKAAGNGKRGGLFGLFGSRPTSPSQVFLDYTGSGQRAQLTQNLDMNRFRPQYNTGGTGILSALGNAITGAIANNASQGTYYVGSPEREPGYLTSPPGQVPIDPFGAQVLAPVYGPDVLGKEYEGVDKDFKFGLAGKPFVDDGSIVGGFSWVSQKWAPNAGRYQKPGGDYGTQDPAYPSISNQFTSTESVNYEFKPGSILDDTQRLIDSQPNSGARFGHVGNAISQTSKVFFDGYKEITKGSQIVRYSDGQANVGIEYCRVFTKDTPYYTFNNLQKKDGNIRKFSYSVMDSTFNINIAPEKGGDSVVNGKVKKYMFSIENLAWRTGYRAGYRVDDLPACEKGPNGGRVMWFPPYDLSFTEDTRPSFNETTFLGRPEPIYTYKNTSRSGTLKWKMIVDHPSILNLIVNKVLANEGDRQKVDSIVDSFFAGCKKYDLYELAKIYNTVPLTDLQAWQEIITNPNATNTNIVDASRATNTAPTNSLQDGGTTDDATGNPTLNEYNGFGFYFDNDIPSPTSVAFQTTYANYTSASNKQVYNNNSKDKQVTTQFFDGVIEENYTRLKEMAQKMYNILSQKQASSILVTLEASASPSSSIDYNDKLSVRRGESVVEFFKTYSFGANNNSLGQFIGSTLVFNTIAKGEVASVTPRGKQSYSTYDCKDEALNTEKYTTRAMACRTVLLKNVEIKPIEKNSEPSSTATENSAANNAAGKPNTGQKPGQTNTVVNQQPQKDLYKGASKKLLRYLLNECDYFEVLKAENPFIYDSIKEKIKYFQPAFHSTTPEGLNSRLTFLQQCMRPGETIPTIGTNGEKLYNDALNTSFGAPPIMVLRIGDFYNTKIVPTSLSFSYDKTFDMNPEGIGFQPMIVDVNLSFNFVGGSGLAAPIDTLQNALSFNYYANTEMYDERAEATEDTSKLDKQIIQALIQNPPTVGVANIQNDKTNDGGNTIGVSTFTGLTDSGQTGTIEYATFTNKFVDKTKAYYNGVMNTMDSALLNYNYGMLAILNYGGDNQGYNTGSFNSSTPTETLIYGKPINTQKYVDQAFTALLKDVDDDKLPIFTSGEFTKSIITTAQKRLFKKNYSNFVKTYRSSFLNTITSDVNNLTQLQQDYVYNVDRMNFVASGTTTGHDGKLNDKNIAIIYMTTGQTETVNGTPIDTLTSLRNDYTSIATNNNQFLTDLTAAQLYVTNSYKPDVPGVFTPPTGYEFLSTPEKTREYLLMSRALTIESIKDNFLNALQEGLDVYTKFAVESYYFSGPNSLYVQWPKLNQTGLALMTTFKTSTTGKNYVDYTPSFGTTQKRIVDFSEDNTASEDLKKQLQNLYANKNDSSSINPYNFKKKFN